MSIKKHSIKFIGNGIDKLENKRNVMKKSDFSDFKQFLKTYLNTPESKQRKKLAEEFRKRHLELYEFLKNNGDLISAETEISKTVNDIFSGNKADSENIASKLSDVFRQLGGEGLDE